MCNLWQCYIIHHLGRCYMWRTYLGCSVSARHLMSSHLAYSLSVYEKCGLLFNLDLLLLECLYLTFYPNISSSCSLRITFFIQLYGSTKPCVWGSYVSPQHFVFGVFAVRVQLRLCRNQHFCNVLKFISHCLLLMIWPLLLSQLLLKTTESFQLMAVILLLSYYFIMGGHIRYYNVFIWSFVYILLYRFFFK